MKYFKVIVAFLLLFLLTACNCEHKWSEGNCVTPKKCLNCGAESIDMGEHSFKEASCYHPKTCTMCGETEGEPRGHVFMEATCTSAESCKYCSEVKGERLEHNYVKGKCTLCGGVKDLSAEYDYELASGYDDDNNFYQLVCNESEDYTGLKIEVGAIKNYEWILKPTTKMPFVLKENSFSDEPGAGTVYYIGNGCFLSEKGYNGSALGGVDDFMYVVYNVNSGKSYTTSGYKWHDYRKIPIPTVYDEKYMIIGYTKYEKYTDFILLDKENMTTKNVQIKGYVNSFGKYSEGVFAVAIGDSIYPIYYFYDENGKEKFNLSDYKTYSNQDVYFEDSACKIEIINDNDSKYVITLDKEGNVVDSEEVFE